MNETDGVLCFCVHVLNALALARGGAEGQDYTAGLLLVGFAQEA
jgi:hypothetical protein